MENQKTTQTTFKIMENKKTTQTTFKIVDCHTNKVHHIDATNHDTALRTIASKLGHFCVAFV